MYDFFSDLMASIRNLSKKEGLRKTNRKEKRTAEDARGSLLDEITSGCACLFARESCKLVLRAVDDRLPLHVLAG